MAEKMMNSRTLLALTLLCLGSIGCEMGRCTKGQGEATTTVLSVELFQSLILTNNIGVQLVQGPEQKVVVIGQANLAELINTQVVNGIWSIGIAECFRSRKPLIVQITVPDLRSITVKGSGDINSEGPFRTDTLELTVQGSGDMDLDLEVLRVKATVQGSGDVLLKGSTTSFETRIQGSGDVIAMELAATDVRVAIMGTGDVAVQCNGFLDASIMGSGDIRYRGHPTEILQNVKGSGSIRTEQ